MATATKRQMHTSGPDAAASDLLVACRNIKRVAQAQLESDETKVKLIYRLAATTIAKAQGGTT